MRVSAPLGSLAPVLSLIVNALARPSRMVRLASRNVDTITNVGCLAFFFDFWASKAETASKGFFAYVDIVGVAGVAMTCVVWSTVLGKPAS